MADSPSAIVAEAVAVATGKRDPWSLRNFYESRTTQLILLIAFAIAMTYTLASAAGLAEKLKPITFWYFLRDIIVAVLGFFGSILAYFRGGSGGEGKGTETKGKEGGGGGDKKNKPKPPKTKETPEPQVSPPTIRKATEPQASPEALPVSPPVDVHLSSPPSKAKVAEPVAEMPFPPQSDKQAQTLLNDMQRAPVAEILNNIADAQTQLAAETGDTSYLAGMRDISNTVLNAAQDTARRLPNTANDNFIQAHMNAVAGALGVYANKRARHDKFHQIHAEMTRRLDSDITWAAPYAKSAAETAGAWAGAASEKVQNQVPAITETANDWARAISENARAYENRRNEQQRIAQHIRARAQENREKNAEYYRDYWSQRQSHGSPKPLAIPPVPQPASPVVVSPSSPAPTQSPPVAEVEKAKVACDSWGCYLADGLKKNTRRV